MKRLFLRQAIIFSSTVLMTIPIQAMKDKNSAIAMINQAELATFGKDPSARFPYLWDQKIEWSKWDTMVKQLDSFVATNSQDLLKKQDPRILKYYQTLKDANNRLQNLIKIMYNSYLSSKRLLSKEDYQKASATIGQNTSSIITMIDQAEKNPDLIKLQKDTITLASKKNCIAVLNDFKNRLKILAQAADLRVTLNSLWKRQ
jgi:hypothetical protein